MEVSTIEISNEKLAETLLSSDETVTITRQGQPVGYFLPANLKPRPIDWDALEKKMEPVYRQMAAAGISEEEIMADIARWRRERDAAERTSD